MTGHFCKVSTPVIHIFIQLLLAAGSRLVIAEVILAISGDASAVKEAVLQARQIGLELLIGMGSYPEIPGEPYL